MVFKMRIYIDGGCRGNSQQGAIGAAAAVFRYRNGGTRSYSTYLPSNAEQPPTNQRAELAALILALELAIARNSKLHSNPRLNVAIYTDSKYVHGCITEWVYKWVENGWINAAGKPVANQDLIKTVSDLDDDLKELGKVKYIWIPRAQNKDADKACNKKMDRGC